MPTTIHLVEGVTGGFVPPRMRKRITIELHDDGGTHITKEERSDEAEGGFQRLRSADGVSATQVRALADDAVAAFQTLPHEDPVGGEDLYRLDTTIMIDSGSFKWQNTPNRGCNITPSAVRPTQEQLDQFEAFVQRIHQLADGLATVAA